MSALVLALLLTAPAQGPDPGLTLPSRSKGDMTASLSVRVPEQGRTPGKARVLLELVVTGPKTLVVEETQLEDALAGWKVDWAASSWSESEGRATCSETLHLVQIKPGIIPLPGVTLRLRTSPTAATEEISWPDLLREPRDVAPPIAVPDPPPSPWVDRLLLAGLVLVLVLIFSLVVLTVQMWRAARKRPLSVHERALAKLDEMPADPAAAIVYLDSVLRTYVEERFGIAALRKTNQELLSALVEAGALPPEQVSILADLLYWSELTRFAGVEVAANPEDARRKSKEFLLATATISEQATGGQDGKSRDQKEDAQGG